MLAVPNSPRTLPLPTIRTRPAPPAFLCLMVCTRFCQPSSPTASESSALGWKAPRVLLQPGGCGTRGFVGMGGPGNSSPRCLLMAPRLGPYPGSGRFESGGGEEEPTGPGDCLGKTGNRGLRMTVSLARSTRYLGVMGDPGRDGVCMAADGTISRPWRCWVRGACDFWKVAEPICISGGREIEVEGQCGHHQQRDGESSPGGGGEGQGKSAK